MFITKSHAAAADLPARRGRRAGAAVPRCDGAGAHALAQTAANPQTRFGVVYVPNGAIMEQWTPATVGSELRVLADPEAARAVSRIRWSWSATWHGAGTTIGDHAVAPPGWLTGVLAEARPRPRTSASAPRSTRSSRSRSARTRRFPSLEAGDRRLHRLRRRAARPGSAAPT